MDESEVKEKKKSSKLIEIKEPEQNFVTREEFNSVKKMAEIAFRHIRGPKAKI